MMKEVYKDLVVIGGGPAGLAAALEGKACGIGSVLLLERDFELGGILQQCIHDGFGLLKFNKRMAGCQYAQLYIDKIKASGIEIKLNTMVLNLTADRMVYAVNEEDGMIKIHAGAVILAMGCRERTKAQVFIKGTRPAGIFTAGTVQRYINMEGYHPGKKAVILGSGDIGLIMARRMLLEGIEIEGVYEIMHTPGGLTRNIVQCLEDYGIPLHLGTTVARIHGNKRVEGVTVCKVDRDMKPVKGTERFIECDMLVLSVGLIPENELTKKASIEIHPVTRGPVVDENMMTSVPGIFAAGNVVAVFDLVDYVSRTGETAARGACKYLHGQLDMDGRYCEVKPGDNVSFVLPQRIRIGNMDERLDLYMRVREAAEKVDVTISGNENILNRDRHPVVRPPEMVVAGLPKEAVAGREIDRLKLDAGKGIEHGR